MSGLHKEDKIDRDFECVVSRLETDVTIAYRDASGEKQETIVLYEFRAEEIGEGSDTAEAAATEESACDIVRKERIASFWVHFVSLQGSARSRGGDCEDQRCSRDFGKAAEEHDSKK